MAHCLKCVSAIIPQRPLSAHVPSGLHQKPCSWIFWDYLSRKQEFSWRFLFPDSLSFTQLKVVNFWNIAALKQQLLNSDCLWLLRGQKFFLSQILFELRIVALNLRCYLMVVFCLIFRDYTICSLALHKHLVLVVVKRLSTFAGLALSTLATMFRRAQRSLLAREYVRMISFSSCSWHHSAFWHFKSNFIITYWTHSCNFCINTTKRSRSIIIRTFSGQGFFRWVISDKNFIFRFFWRPNNIFLQSCL